MSRFCPSFFMLAVSICGTALDGLLRCKSFHLRFRLYAPKRFESWKWSKF